MAINIKVILQQTILRFKHKQQKQNNILLYKITEIFINVGIFYNKSEIKI
jgi:hypothetical protein